MLYSNLSVLAMCIRLASDEEDRIGTVGYTIGFKSSNPPMHNYDANAVCASDTGMSVALFGCLE